MTREQLIEEVERIDERHLDLVYRVARSLEAPRAGRNALSWEDFVASTYGCLADAPIERGEQAKPAGSRVHIPCL